ncbi:hypothetical protein AVEN_55421-1 [Araneus ventricosus]|uniref:Uncharacterized protein n=1 Tax=Araneus ventricosus TaxID=182803 RepID=A0A4Y2PY92_ARAVE|nr:hypothetical protein AVEN_55421-1 [Araneus ventricosus]
MELPLSCLGIQGLLNDSRCNGSSTDAGVLAAITGHGPTLPVGGTYYHWRVVTRPPPLLFPQEKRDPVTYQAASHPRARSAPWGIKWRKVHVNRGERVITT